MAILPVPPAPAKKWLSIFWQILFGAAMFVLGGVSHYAYQRIASNSLSRSDQNQKLYIKTTTATKDTRTDSISVVVGEYLSVSINEMDDNSLGYGTKKELHKPEVGEEFKYIFFCVVDSNGGNLYFKSPDEFLNFMHERGYDVSDQRPIRYGVDYTFRKRHGE